MLVALEGFEPSQAEPESDVLPLHHKAISICRKANLNLFLSFSATFVAWGCSRFAIAKLGRFYQFSKYFRIFFHFFLTGPCATFANGLYISKMKQYTHTKKCASASQHHISNLRNDKNHISMVTSIPVSKIKRIKVYQSACASATTGATQDYPLYTPHICPGFPH